MRKTLEFYRGRLRNKILTDWLMYEYRLKDQRLTVANIPQDTYVLCRIFKKNASLDDDCNYDFDDDEIDSLVPHPSALLSSIVPVNSQTLQSNLTGHHSGNRGESVLESSIDGSLVPPIAVPSSSGPGDGLSAQSNMTVHYSRDREPSLIGSLAPHPLVKPSSSTRCVDDQIAVSSMKKLRNGDRHEPPSTEQFGSHFVAEQAESSGRDLFSVDELIPGWDLWAEQCQKDTNEGFISLDDLRPMGTDLGMFGDWFVPRESLSQPPEAMDGPRGSDFATPTSFALGERRVSHVPQPSERANMSSTTSHTR